MPASVFVSLSRSCFPRQAAKPVPEADDFHAVDPQRGFADAADGGVETRAVAARRENPDAFAPAHNQVGRSLRHFT